MSSPITNIDRNITEYLYIDRVCPSCGTTAGVSLGMIHSLKGVQCPRCKTAIQFLFPWEPLSQFAKSYDALHEALHKNGVRLYFPHNPVATIWKRDDKP